MADKYNVPDNFSAFEVTHGIFISSGPQGLTAQQKELLFPAQGELRFVGIVSDHAYGVTLDEGSKEWLSFQTVSEGLNVTVAPNGTGADRTGTITVKTVPVGKEEEKSVEISVKQSKHSSLNFTVSPSVVSVEATGETVDLDVLTQKAYTVFSGSSWCRVTPTFGNTTEQAKLEIDKNTSKSARTAQLTYRCGAKQVKVDVTQAGAED